MITESTLVKSKSLNDNLNNNFNAQDRVRLDCFNVLLIRYIPKSGMLVSLILCDRQIHRMKHYFEYLTILNYSFVLKNIYTLLNNLYILHLNLIGFKLV